MSFGLLQTVAPSSEPCDTTTLKKMLRINVTDEDSLLSGYLVAARQTFENLSGTQINVATWKMFLDFWPGFENIWLNAGSRQYDPSYYMYQLLYQPFQLIYLPRAPLISVGSIKYYDNANVLQTWDASNYTVDISRQPGRIYCTGVFPTTATTHKPSIEITFNSGYTSAPTLICQAIYLLAGTFYEQRTSITEARLNELPYGFLAIVDQYRTFILSDMGMK